MEISYRIGKDLDLDRVIAVYASSGLGARRPIENKPRFEAMLRNANLVVTAWAGEELVGIARSLTDWVYITYLADLAVTAEYQRRGIGQELIRQTRQACEPGTTLLLLAAPAAETYYPHIGFQHHPQAWLLPGDSGQKAQSRSS